MIIVQLDVFATLTIVYCHIDFKVLFDHKELHFTYAIRKAVYKTKKIYFQESIF